MVGQKELIANSRRYGQKPSPAQEAKKVRKKAADAAREQQRASYMKRVARTGARAQAVAANKKPKAKRLKPGEAGAKAGKKGAQRGAAASRKATATVQQLKKQNQQRRKKAAAKSRPRNLLTKRK